MTLPLSHPERHVQTAPRRSAPCPRALPPGGALTRWRRKKCRLKFLLCCRCCQAPLRIFSSLRSLGAVSHGPDRSGGFLWRWDLCVSNDLLIRAGSHARHPMLSASFDDSRKSCGRRPHLSDGFFERPGSLTGRLHQHQAPRGDSAPYYKRLRLFKDRPLREYPTSQGSATGQ